MRIVVILPTFNEVENIHLIIERIFEQQSQLEKNDQLLVLVGDSHSTDGTLESVRQIAENNPKVSVLDVKQRGIGAGLYYSYEFAFKTLKADAVIQLDADLQHNPKEIPNFIRELKNGFEFVQGSRFIKGGRNDLELYRQILSYLANSITRILLAIYHIHEFTTSYRAFSKKLYHKLDLDDIPWQGKSFVFQPAFLYAVARTGLTMKEIPIVFSDRRKGYSKMQVILYALDLLSFGLKTRIKNSRTFWKFATVGSFGTIIDFGMLFIGVEYLKYSPPLAKFISVSLAIINNFLGNNFWTFRKRRQRRSFSKRFIYYVGVSAIALFLQVGSMAFLTAIFSPKYYLLYNIIIMPAVISWNFWANSHFTFKHAKTQTTHSNPGL